MMVAASNGFAWSVFTIIALTNEFSGVKSIGGKWSYLSMMAEIFTFNLTGAPGTIGGSYKSMRRHRVK